MWRWHPALPFTRGSDAAGVMESHVTKKGAGVPRSRARLD